MLMAVINGDFPSPDPRRKFPLTPKKKMHFPMKLSTIAILEIFSTPSLRISMLPMSLVRFNLQVKNCLFLWLALTMQGKTFWLGTSRRKINLM